MPMSFKVTPEEHAIIVAIAQRAAKTDSSYPPLTAAMDVCACHANGCPLRLSELRDADDFTFAHDVFGIRRHIDRKTGRLGDCFLPRCATADHD